jgi:hypothetical protein
MHLTLLHPVPLSLDWLGPNFEVFLPSPSGPATQQKLFSYHFWGNSRLALKEAKPYAASLKNTYSGVSAEGLDWIDQGYSDPDRTGNGFKVLYQRCVLGRELLQRSIYNTGN